MQPPTSHTRRKFLASSLGSLTQAGIAGLALAELGCVPPSAASRMPDLVWGRRGLSDGRLMKPRAMAIDAADQLYIVDMTGRIQVFDVDGNYLRGWRTPEIKQGKPTGLGFAQDGTLLVADTHYFRVLFYTKSGELDEERTIGGQFGDEPGQFHFVTDVAQDRRGHFFVGQYGQIDRIQEFDPQGNFLRVWGSQGSDPGQFSRPQALMFDEDNRLWVADACNHRIQIFDVDGETPELVDMWGTSGRQVGQLQTPYGFDFDVDGTLLIAEFGNHRVQRFSKSGEFLEVWGQVGDAPGLFNSPWALIIDSQRNLHVLDTMNHRVQRFRLV
jgi:sugar lactone lactonase YvrE